MKKYGTILLIFLLILAVCTYISHQVYQDSLLCVTVAAPQSAALHHQWELTGQLRHESQDIYSFPIQTHVLEYKFQTGQWVSAGNALLQLDPEQLHVQWLQCKIEEEDLSEKLEKEDGYQKELLQYQYNTLQQTIQEIEVLIEAQGWVFAREDGVVLSANGATQIPANTPAMTLGPAAGRKQIVFPITALQKQYCPPGTMLDAALTLNTGSATEEISAAWTFYSAVQQQEQCVNVTFLPLNMLDGQTVTATLSAESKVYDYVIPTSAIISNDNGNVSFYVLEEKETVLGTEQVIYPYSAFALEQNEFYTALSLPVPYPVVTSWDKSPSHGSAVRIVE